MFFKRNHECGFTELESTASVLKYNLKFRVTCIFYDILFHFIHMKKTILGISHTQGSARCKQMAAWDCVSAERRAISSTFPSVCSQSSPGSAEVLDSTAENPTKLFI